MKAYVEVVIWTYTLPSALNGQLRALATIPDGIEQPVATEEDAWWDRQLTRTFGRTEKSLAPNGPACNLVTVTTTLSQTLHRPIELHVVHSVNCTGFNLNILRHGKTFSNYRGQQLFIITVT